LTTALGGALLLTHSHAIANIKDQLLIEMSHTPLALCGVAAGWARWLELRPDPDGILALANRLHFGRAYPAGLPRSMNSRGDDERLKCLSRPHRSSP